MASIGWKEKILLLVASYVLLNKLSSSLSFKKLC